MDKEQVISFIRSQLLSGAITAEDLYQVARGEGAASPVAVSLPKTADSSRNLINIFYAIGAIIAIVGAGILVGQHWEDIGFLGRILVSLGISVVSFISAMLLVSPTRRVISQVFFTVSAALFPLGIYVLLSEAGHTFDATAQMWTGLGLLVVFLVAYLLTRRNVLVLFSTWYATWAFYAFFVDALVSEWEFMKWATLVVGASYIFIGFWFRSVSLATDPADEKEKASVGGVLYALGTLALLGAGISIGGFFDLLYILLVFGLFYVSVYLRSRSILILSGLFLIGHIFKLTSEYFADSVGWPIALVVIGFLVIGVGSLTYYVNRTYLSRQA